MELLTIAILACLKHTCNHTYQLIYQYKLCFLPTEGIYGFRKILKMKPSPPPGGQGPLIIEASRSQSDTPLSAELLWTSDQPNAENSNWKMTPMHPVGFEPAIPESERPQTHTAIGQNETYYFLKQQKRHGISNGDDVFSMKYKHNKTVSSLPRNRLKFSPASSYTCANLWLMSGSETKRVEGAVSSACSIWFCFSFNSMLVIWVHKQ